MDIDRLIPSRECRDVRQRFGSLMDIDRLILADTTARARSGFGSLMDIDRLIHKDDPPALSPVLVL